MSESAADSISLEAKEQIHAVLDQLVLELHERDREAILLRFFEGHAYSEIAARIALSEKAAHKRVERALERLRQNLARRGITSSIEALGVILGSQALGAPSGLAATVTGAALASPAPVAAFSALKLMTMTKTSAGILAFFGILAVGLVVQNTAELDRAAKALAISQQQCTKLVGQYRQLGQKFQALEADLLVSRSVASTQGNATPAALSPDGLSAGGGISIRKSSNPVVSVATLNEDPEVHEALGKLVDLESTKFFGPLLEGYGLSPAQIQRAEYLVGQLELFGGFASDALSFKTDPRSRSEIGVELEQLVGSAALTNLDTFLLSRFVTEKLAGTLYDTDSPLTAAQASQLTQVLVKANPVIHPGAGWFAPEKTDWTAALGQASQFLTPVQLARLTDVATARYGYSPP